MCVAIKVYFYYGGVAIVMASSSVTAVARLHNILVDACDGFVRFQLTFAQIVLIHNVVVP